MDLSQESVLCCLVSEGGKMKKSELVAKFKGAVDSLDPAEKERNRELFKTLVNNVALVKEIDGVRYVVLKKAFQHLLQSGEKAERSVENKDLKLKVSKLKTCDGEDPADILSPIHLALQRSKNKNHSVKRTLTFHVQTKSLNDEEPRTIIKTQSNPPPPEIQNVIHLDDSPEGQRQKRVFSSVETIENIRRSSKSTKSSEELNEARVTSTVPLDQSEHELLVKCAAGHWSHVYGLLLRDQQLAEKKDFMSGFTALHWATKCGNADMLVKIIDLSKKQGGLEVNVNVRTHGGYTPLHIAALHDQQYILAMLVKEFGANTSIRDHCGKKAYHYLHEGTSESVREMLGQPKPPQIPPDTASQENKEEQDLFPDLSKGLHTISRLLQPTVGGYKKKNKQRMGLRSMGDEPSEEAADNSFRYSAGSDVFM